MGNNLRIKFGTEDTLGAIDCFREQIPIYNFDNIHYAQTIQTSSGPVASRPRKHLIIKFGNFQPMWD